MTAMPSPDSPAAAAARGRVFREWVFLVLALLAMAALWAAERYTSYAQTGDQERDRLSAQARSLDASVQRQLQRLDKLLAAVADESTPIADPAAGSSQRLRRYVPLLVGLRELRLLDGEGRIVESSQAERLGLSLRDSAGFKRAMQPAPASLAPAAPLVYRHNDGRFLTADRVVQDASGHVVGLVSAVVDAQFFASVLASAPYAADMTAALTFADGRIWLTVPANATASTAPSTTIRDPLFDRWREGISVSPVSWGLGAGQSGAHVGVWSQVGRTDETGLALILQRDREQVFSLWGSQTFWIAGSYLLISALLATCLWLRQQRRQSVAQELSTIEHLRREHAERMELALGGADLGLWDWHVPRGRVVRDQRWCAQLGYELSELAPTVAAWEAMLHPDDRAGVNMALSKHFSGVTEFCECEYRMRHKAGHWVWIQERGKVMERDANGAAVRMLGTHLDISMRKHVEVDLRQSRALVRTLIETIPDMIWLKDVDGVYLDCNPAFERLWNKPRAQIVGKTDLDFVPAEAAALFRELDRAAMATDAPVVYEDWKTLAVDGSRCVYESIKKAMRDPQGRVIGVMGISRDISQRKRDQQEIHRLAFHDALTGLPNRRLLEDRLQRAMLMSARGGQFGAVLFMDIDNFKSLNDALGHDAGDLLLKIVGQRLMAHVRAQDTVARLGGDEFVVVLAELSIDEVAAVAQAQSVAEKILSALNAPYTLADHVCHSTPSIGLVMFKGVTVAVDDILKQADHAMYKAKGAGRNTMRFYNTASSDLDSA
ncbi:MAG: diguanylate cyclase [Hylemonella sp.]|nr:diguanylate cyclase [Hylemonella sp.]